MSFPQALIQQIHNSPVQVVLAVTGGGSAAIAQLLEIPGGSRTLLEAQIPYGRKALIQFLGAEPEHFCSASTARALAATAYLRALKLREADDPVAGVACCASLASDPPKKGAHRCHVAVQDKHSTRTLSLELAKGRRERRGEEQVVGGLTLAAIAFACNVVLHFEGARDQCLGLCASEHVEARHTRAPQAIAALFAQEIPLVIRSRDGQMQADAPMRASCFPRPKVVLPGAFNPLHHGHEQLAAVVSRLTGNEVFFEISLLNVEKPPLNFTDLEDRLAQFTGKAAVALTCAPTFVEKARVLPGCTFVVGFDTALRIVEPCYYGGESAMLAALADLDHLGCRFLVAGRVDAGRFRTLAEINLPAAYRDLFQELPESEFRVDLSSTQLRAAQSSE